MLIGSTAREWRVALDLSPELVASALRVTPAELREFEGQTTPGLLSRAAWLVLRRALEARVRRHLEAAPGNRWQDLVGHLGPLLASDIRPAALTVIAEMQDENPAEKAALETA